MNEIAIALPKLDEQLMAEIESETVSTLSLETDAIRLLREQYSKLAKHGWIIQTSYDGVADSNFSRHDKTYHEQNGVTATAILAMDGFDDKKTDQNRGTYFGCRLYLTQFGEWLELTRDGVWSNWQGEPCNWKCSIQVLTDADVAEQYNLNDIVERFSQSLASLAEALPKRMTRIRERAMLASQILSAIPDAK